MLGQKSLTNFRLAPQNDRLNLSFVKNIYVVGKNRLEMVVKVTFVILLFYASEFIELTNPIFFQL